VVNKQVLNWSKDLAPAVLVLLVSIIYAILYGDFAPLTKWHVAAWMAPLRFARFTFLLCIPLFVLPKIYRFAVRKMADTLIRINRRQRHATVDPFKHWLFRPMQGIGIGLVFGTKLIAVLQLISGPADGSTLLMSESIFQFGRFLTVMAITIVVSLLLSTLWTFDDMGIRYYNKNNQELKMMGKYAGTVVPFVFGMYGIFSLLSSYPIGETSLLVFKIAVVLYPPLAVFTIVHAYFVDKKMKLFLDHNLKKGGVYLDNI
jgi:hypothetical protein